MKMLRAFSIGSIAAAMILAVVLLLLGGCIVEPWPGPYGHPRPVAPYYNGPRY